MPVTINTLETENFKRIKAVKIEFTEKGLTVIGGRNGQGKTSVLDDIAFVLGGGKFAPSNIAREGSLANPYSKITLSNGLIAERSGKNSTLKVTDPSGLSGGQKLLDSFISELALNLPKFLNATSREKAKTLLQIIGVEAELNQLEQEEERIYNERTTVGRISDQKRKFADEMQEYPDAPEAPISASELIQSQQAILAKNGENKTKRENRDNLLFDLAYAFDRVFNLDRELKKAELRRNNLDADYATALKSAEQLQDESTEAIETSLRDIESINVRVRANLDKAKAKSDAGTYQLQYGELTAKLEEVRISKMALLDGANLPLPGLSVAKGELLYNNQAWDGMSSSEQLRVATAIVRCLNPECGFVLLDKLEQMDTQTLSEFGQWLESEGLQVIATRVSTGEECSIIIEDGFVQGQVFEPKPAATPTSYEW